MTLLLCLLFLPSLTLSSPFCAPPSLTNLSTPISWQGDTHALLDSISSALGSCDLTSTAPDFSVFFRPNVTGLYVWDSEGSQFDTTLTIIDCVTRLAVHCDDDGGTGLTSMLTVRLNAGTTYWIVLDGWSMFDRGAFVLNGRALFWPDQHCPAVNRFVNGTSPGISVIENELSWNLLTRSRLVLNSYSDLSSNYSNCSSSSAVDSSLSQFAQVTGLRVKKSALYSFLMCTGTGSMMTSGDTLSFEVYACSTGKCAATSSPKNNTLSLNASADEYISLVARPRSALAFGEMYTIYYTLNPSLNALAQVANPSLDSCFTCKPEIEVNTIYNGQLLKRNNSSSQPQLQASSSCSNETTTAVVAAQSLFLWLDRAKPLWLRTCGSINTNVRATLCGNNFTTCSDPTTGNGFEIYSNATQLLYVVTITPRTDLDDGPFALSVQHLTDRTSSSPQKLCDEQTIHDSRKIPVRFCMEGERSYYIGVMIAFLVLFALCCVTMYVFSGTDEKIYKFGIFPSAILAFFGAFLTAVWTADCTSSQRVLNADDFSIMLVSLCCFGTFFINYRVLFHDYTSAFARDATFPLFDSESTFWLVCAGCVCVCVFLAGTVVGLHMMTSLSENSVTFPLCAYNDEICLIATPRSGIVIQQIFSIRQTTYVESDGSMLFESWSSRIGYVLESTTFPCSVPTTTTSIRMCTNTCLNATGVPLYNNGICEDSNGMNHCVTGEDCSDCGARVRNTTTRLLRCNFSTSLIAIWDAYPSIWGMTFGVTLMPALLFFTWLIWIGVLLRRRVESDRRDSDELSEPMEDDGEVNIVGGGGAGQVAAAREVSSVRVDDRHVNMRWDASNTAGAGIAPAEHGEGIAMIHIEQQRRV